VPDTDDISARPPLAPQASVEAFEVYSITEKARAMTGEKFVPFSSPQRQSLRARLSSQQLFQRMGSSKTKLKVAAAKKGSDGNIPETRPRDASADFFGGIHDTEFDSHQKGSYSCFVCRQYTQAIMESWLYRIFLVFATLFALFAKDVVEYEQVGKVGYEIVDLGTAAVFAFFILEMAASSIAVSSRLPRSF
jgi:hypothetical protein